MDENDRQSLTDHAVLINKDLVVDEEFLAYFEKDRILSPGMIEEIEVRSNLALKFNICKLGQGSFWVPSSL